jgi:hypothetical protein
MVIKNNTNPIILFIDRIADLQYAALFLVIVGVWLIAEKDVAGQYCMLAAQVLWLVIALKRKMVGLALQSLVLFGITCRAAYLWGGV